MTTTAPADPTPASPVTGSWGHLAVLDGLRGLAVAAVVAFHLAPGAVPGGYLGVEVFFVVSGFLITALLRHERASSGRVDLRRFWARRARRLLPTLLVTVAAVLLAVLLVQPDRFGRTVAEAVAGLGYVSNWYLIVREVPYFEQFEAPSPLLHLWSLAIEEQFYLVWPLLIAAAARVRRGPLIAGLVGVAAASTLWARALEAPGTDAARTYYGTDTRLTGLLLGAALAVAWPARRARLPGPGRDATDVLGWVALGVLGALVVATPIAATSRASALAIAAVASVALIAVAVRGERGETGPFGCGLAVVLSVGWLRWLGLRSYALYLVHWPLIVLTEPSTGSTPDWLVTSVQLAGSLVLADVVHRRIEVPLRGASTPPLVRSPWSSDRVLRSIAATMVVSIIVTTSVVLAPRVDIGVSAGDVVAALDLSDGLPPLPVDEPSEPVGEGSPPRPADAAPDEVPPPRPADEPATPDEPPPPRPADEPATPDEALPPRPADESATPDEAATAPADVDAAPVDEAARAPTDVPAEADAAPVVASQPSTVLVVGDSVLLGAADAVRARSGANVIVDAAVGRQLRDAPAVIAAHDARNDLATVVVHLGTNGPFHSDDLAEVIAAAPGADVVVMTVRVPRDYEGRVNDALARGAQASDRAQLLDWHALARDDPGLLGRDGVHLTGRGIATYADAVAAAVG